MNLKTALLPCAAFLLMTDSAGMLAAEPAPRNYPQRPIRAIVPQSPGGANDLTARLLAPLLSERLGQSIVVDNRAGAGSLVGTELVAKAPPDGYTLLVSPSALTINPSMYQKLPFDPVKDFAPITTLSAYPNLLVVHPALAVNSVKDLIALARAKPGTLNFGSGGPGTGTHLGAELFKSVTGVNIVHVPYKGGGPAVAALIGGQVQLYFGGIGTVIGHVKSGKLKALGVTSVKRSPVAPDVPPIADAGFPGYEHITWNGLLAPAGTSVAIVRRLNSEVNFVLKTATVRERFLADGVEPGGISAEEFAAMIKREIANWAKVIRAAGIQPE